MSLHDLQLDLQTYDLRIYVTKLIVQSYTVTGTITEIV